jgi:hypothetical protein
MASSIFYKRETDAMTGIRTFGIDVSSIAAQLIGRRWSPSQFTLFLSVRRTSAFKKENY